MKNNIFSVLGLFVLTFLSSCSKNSNDELAIVNPPANTIKKIIETVYYNATPTTSFATFIYENGILKQLQADSNYRLDFEYDGNKLMNSKRYQNSILQGTTNLIYNGNLLQIVQVNAGERTQFTYQGNVLKSSEYQSNSNSGWTTLESKNYTFDANNNISETLRFNNFSGTPSNYKYGSTYDNKNNPFSQMNPYIRLFFDFETIDILSQNNKSKTFTFTSPTSTTSTQTEYYEIIYNSQNYPTSVKKKRFTTNVLVSEMSIEYN